MTDLQEKAMKMALEVLNIQTPLDKREFELRNSAIEALRQALAQPEQRGHCTCGDPTILGYVHFRTRPCIYYTAPPKREWVGLTKEDMPVGDNPIFDTDEFAFGAAWAQAKLKEKNT